MLKKIKHPHQLEMKMFLESSNFSELENITIKIIELNTEHKTIEDGEDYLELKFKRIIKKENNNFLNDIKDNSKDLVNAISPIVNEKNDEFICNAVKIEKTGNLNRFIYLEKIIAHGDFSRLSMTAAIAKSFKSLANGKNEEWIAVLYEKNTFYFEDKKIPEDEVKIYLKDLNLFKLPKSASGIKKENNILLVASGNTLNTDICLEPKLERALRLKF